MGILGDVWKGTKGALTSGEGLDVWDVATFGKSSEGGKRKIGNLWKDASGVTAAEGAAESQRKGLSEAQSSIERMFGESMETQRPWLEAGQRGLAGLESGIESGQFDMTPGQFQGEEFQFDFEADPGYQFRLQQGQDLIEGSAAARGGLFSGETGKSLQEFGQGLASQEYGQAYNRARGEFESDRGFGYGAFMDDFNRERATKMDQYNRLAALSGTGQVAAGNVGSQQIAQGGNLANIAMQRGNIGAQRSMAGYQGGMNLINTGLQAASTISGMIAPTPKAGG